jgi:hypothetical protein
MLFDIEQLKKLNCLPYLIGQHQARTTRTMSFQHP